MRGKIKAVMQKEGWSWEKLAKANGGAQRANFQKSVEGWANKLNNAMNKMGYEVVIKKMTAEEVGVEGIKPID